MIVLACIALGLATAAIATSAAFALKAINAEHAAGISAAASVKAAAELEAVTKERDAETARANDERKRADALDDLLAQAATTGPVDGGYDRLLQAWHVTRAAHRPGPRALPSDPAAETKRDLGPDDLLPPGS